MEDTELSLYDLFALILRKWRGIVIFALVVAVLAGLVGGVVLRYLDMNNPEKIEEWQEEFEAAYGAYHAEINAFDRQIEEHSRAVLVAQTKLNDLNRQIDINENSIEKYRDNISKYVARIADYEEDIIILESDIEKQKYLLKYQEEQNENSLYMDIDPYDVKTYEAYIRVDSGYQIIPNATYQDINPTSEILNTYIMLVNNTAFYEKMIKDLKLNTEVRYLTEVVSVSTYNTNSLKIKVIGSDATTVEKIAKYISKEILDNHNAVSLSVKEHSIALFNEKSYSSIDVNVYTKQQDNLKKVSNYYASIRDIEMSILNLNTSIRDLNTDIFNAEVRIAEIQEDISLIPSEVDAVKAQIAAHEDDTFVLRNEKAEFLEEEKEPKYAGYTYFSLITGFAKFAIIGGVLAGVIAVGYVVVIALMGGKVLSADMICAYSKTSFFGVWPSNKKRPFAFVDKWVDAILGVSTKKSVDEVAAVVLSNLAVSSAGQSEVLLCGGANEETLLDIQKKISAKCPSVKFIIGGTIGEDSRTIEGLATCSAVVIVEERYVSEMKSVQELKKRAASMDKPILGVVII